MHLTWISTLHASSGIVKCSMFYSLPLSCGKLWITKTCLREQRRHRQHTGWPLRWRQGTLSVPSAAEAQLHFAPCPSARVLISLYRRVSSRSWHGCLTRPRGMFFNLSDGAYLKVISSFSEHYLVVCYPVGWQANKYARLKLVCERVGELLFLVDGVIWPALLRLALHWPAWPL